MLEIRRASPDEGPILLDLIRALADYEKLDPPDEAAQGRLLRDIFGGRPRLEAYLAYADGVPAAYALVLETYSSFLALPTLYLEDIFVQPEFRGRGAGAALFKELVAEAERRGCGRMEWVVLDWNRLAQEFYARFGASHLSDWMTMRLTRDDFGRILKQ
ncbi:MAG: GNAT family N-acetyltransferase [Candidatus Solibacter usitatus]|nr:GNAT family N-acetyltransferase [Candidatus Solibacter usitatus]